MEQINLQIIDESPRILILNEMTQISFPEPTIIIQPINEGPNLYLAKEAEAIIP